MFSKLYLQLIHSSLPALLYLKNKKVPLTLAHRWSKWHSELAERRKSKWRSNFVSILSALLYPLQRTNIKHCYSNPYHKRVSNIQKETTLLRHIFSKITPMLPRVSWSHHIPPNWHLGTQLKLQHIFWHTEKYLLHLLELCFKLRIICYTYDSYPFCHKHWLKLLDANGKNTDVISLIYDLLHFFSSTVWPHSPTSVSQTQHNWNRTPHSHPQIYLFNVYIAWMIVIQYNSSSFARSKLQDHHDLVVRSTEVKNAWFYP